MMHGHTNLKIIHIIHFLTNDGCICYNIFIAQTHLSAKYCGQKFVRLLHVIVKTKLPPLTYNSKQLYPLYTRNGG